MNKSIEYGDSMIGVSFDGAAAKLGGNLPAAGGGAVAPARPALHGRYIVETRGKTAAQILAAIDALATYHAAKSARIYDGEALLGTAFVVAGVAYTWTDCTIRERGTDVELHVNVVDATGARPKCMPFERVYGTIEQVPPNAAIAAMVQQAIADEISSNADHQATIASVQAALLLTP